MVTSWQPLASNHLAGRRICFRSQSHRSTPEVVSCSDRTRWRIEMRRLEMLEHGLRYNKPTLRFMIAGLPKSSLTLEKCRKRDGDDDSPHAPLAERDITLSPQRTFLLHRQLDRQIFACAREGVSRDFIVQLDILGHASSPKQGSRVDRQPFSERLYVCFKLFIRVVGFSLTVSTQLRPRDSIQTDQVGSQSLHDR